MTRIFVSVYDENDRLLQHKTAIDIPDGESPIKYAKQLRHDSALKQGIRPSLLSWAVFYDTHATRPALNSRNWYSIIPARSEFPEPEGILG